jgi:hypothetical protein
MASVPHYVEFQPDRLEEVLATMEDLSTAGKGWVNFEPAVDAEDVAREGSGTFALFSGRGPVVPLGTWTPGSTSRKGRQEPAMIGLQHPAGARAKPLLAQRGHPLPQGWIVVQDHVRKGLVVQVPAEVDARRAVDWLLRAAALLSTVPLVGWRAAVYRG